MSPAVPQRLGHLTQEVSAERGVIVGERYMHACYRIERTVAVRAEAAAGSVYADSTRKVSSHHFTRERISAVVRDHDRVRWIRAGFDRTQRPEKIPGTIAPADYIPGSAAHQTDWVDQQWCPCIFPAFSGSVPRMRDTARCPI
jgi:hypothetical protein